MTASLAAIVYGPSGNYRLVHDLSHTYLSADNPACPNLLTTKLLHDPQCYVPRLPHPAAVLEGRLRRADLAQRVGQVLLGADDVADGHQGVVDGHAEIVHGLAVGAQDDEIAERVSVPGHLAADGIVDGNLRVLQGRTRWWLDVDIWG